MDDVILITGAQGSIGSMLRTSLRQPGRRLRLLDVTPLYPLEPGEKAELITGSFLDPETIAAACSGVRAIVHMGLSHAGFSWPEYLEVNIHGTQVVADAARRAGAERVVYASSNHAVGFVPLLDGGVVPDHEYPRPDSYYGVSKAAARACSASTTTVTGSTQSACASARIASARSIDARSGVGSPRATALDSSRRRSPHLTPGSA